MGKRWSLIAALLAMGCESRGTVEPLAPVEPGPDSSTWTPPGSRGFGATSGGDSTGRARFCDQAEADTQVAEMVREPIVPGVSVGGVPLAAEDGSPIAADSLLGRPENMKFCDPGGVYSNAFTYGPLNEIIIFFDEETRLVDGIQINANYEGVLTGSVRVGDQTETVLLDMRERARIGGRELAEYASPDTQATRSNSWLNHANITKMYGMIRQTFFGEEAFAADYNCVADRRCDVLYTASAGPASPQQTNVIFRDSGITLVFTPTGELQYLVAEPVRKAAFELGGAVDFGAPTLAPTFRSSTVSGCNLTFGGTMTWRQFREACIESDREVARAGFDVHTQRDGVSVAFDGMTLDFYRDTTARPILRDGERPNDNDVLYGMSYIRSLPAATTQFVAANLASEYIRLLQARLADSLSADASATHPFRMLDINIPALSTNPQAIGALMAGRNSWVPQVLAEVKAAYAALSRADKAAVNPQAVSDVGLVEPLVEATLLAFSGGRSAAEGSETVFRTTDNLRWSIGYSNFVVGGVPYRLVAQYSLFYHAITSVSIESGYSRIDEPMNAVAAQARSTFGWYTSPYYNSFLAFEHDALAFNPYRLGNTGITVGAPDRGLGMLAVTLAVPGGAPIMVQTPGTHIDDRAGFSRQLRGQRWEFVPAHEVLLFGHETFQAIHVDANGEVARVEERQFKGGHELCDGLELTYGMNVRDAVTAYSAAVGDDTYTACDLVFNYSEDGHVLSSVASLTNKIVFYTVGGRATTVARWR